MKSLNGSEQKIEHDFTVFFRSEKIFPVFFSSMLKYIFLASLMYKGGFMLLDAEAFLVPQIDFI